ncbi:Serpentine receptor class r-10 [Caenorhabditis elegans]|uniref:Serpentine receptor class r-10 n=1 Tax=Caenorhabditis elegans TaxID=6239 RepID=Q9XUJ3_CAEEL|nr:Seven TM Receptor [Caenorhabditis elegans]CAB04945.2 Seven TM Receptor [Caenorhabditis elegans]|eukprot:NP_499426.2 Seven TM Receptor [Caenorhabditis elegans]
MLTKIIFKRVFAIFGVVNNFLLIIFIIFKSPKQFGNYKCLMAYISIFEIFYSILDFLTVPTIYSHNSAFLVIIEKDSAIFPDSLLQVANISFCSLFGMSMAIFAIHFVYRLLVMIGPKYLYHYHLQKVLGLIGCTIIVGCGWTVVMHISFGPTKYSDSLISLEYLEPRNLTLSDVDYVGAHFHHTDSYGNQFINWNSMIALVMMTIAIMLSFTTVILCGLKIYKDAQENLSLRSSTDNNIQSQIFWALVLQTIIPVVLMHFPAGIGYLFSMLNRSTEILGEIPAITIFMYPALDPLPSFFIIRSYREAILELLGCKKSEMSVIPTEMSLQVIRTPAGKTPEENR